MKKLIIKFIVITLIMYILFKYNVYIKNNTYNIFILFIKDVIPSLFPIIIITNYIKYKILNNNSKESKIIKYISFLFSYSPVNTVIADSNKELLYSSIINPLFSYNIISIILNKKTSLIIVITNMIIRYTLLYKYIVINKNDDQSKNKISKNINQIINDSFITVINIFGITIFFNIIISILSLFINNKILFFIEITNGFNIIKTISSYKINLILCSFINSFKGIAIYFQIKSINNDANYKYLISDFVLSIIITIITYSLVLSFI